MIPLTVGEIARVTGGVVHGDPGVLVDGAAYVDSRTPVPGGLYLAIVGERVDGHDFADGAHAVLGSRPTAAPTVVVDDPVTAAGRLARHVVDALQVPVHQRGNQVKCMSDRSAGTSGHRTQAQERHGSVEHRRA